MITESERRLQKIRLRRAREEREKSKKDELSPLENIICFIIAAVITIAGVVALIFAVIAFFDFILPSPYRYEEPTKEQILERQSHFSGNFSGCVESEGCGDCIALYYSWPKNDGDFEVWNKGIDDAGCAGVPASSPEESPNEYEEMPSP